MELILKQPINKPPCICILFENVYEAGNLNRQWVNNYHTHSYRIVMEVINGSLKLTMIMDGMGDKSTYDNLKYSPEKLAQFLLETNGAKSFNFCHIITVKDKQEVVRTVSCARLFVLKVYDVKFVLEG